MKAAQGDEAVSAQGAGRQGLPSAEPTHRLLCAFLLTVGKPSTGLTLCSEKNPNPPPRPMGLHPHPTPLASLSSALAFL